MFNPNELVLEKIRAVEEYDTKTMELISRTTQPEDASLKTSADASEVTDASGATIATFYNAQKGTFEYTNSLFSLDLAASQFGTEKVVAGSTTKIKIPVSEVIEIASDNTVTLKYTPVGTSKAEVKYVKVIDENNNVSSTLEVSSTDAAGKFTLDAASKKLTLPTGTKGRVFVNYERESEKAVQVTKDTESLPKVRTLLIHAIFHNPCDENTVYAGVIRCPRAKIDPSSVELALKSDGKHPVTYNLQKEYCSEAGKLFDIFVSED